jgi:hypothetical protein
MGSDLPCELCQPLSSQRSSTCNGGTLKSAQHTDNYNVDVPRSGVAMCVCGEQSRIRKLITTYKSGPNPVSEKSSLAEMP